MTAEQVADLQLQLNNALAGEVKALEELAEANDELDTNIHNNIDLTLSLAASERRNAEREELLLRCMHAFNHVVGFSDQVTRSAWYENFLKPVSGAILLYLAKTTSEPPAKPSESGASHE
ncbi:hypothetical protein QN399_01165 [Pseudomonas sp. 10C3]|uniref:hypothetical protein n=1 Tax=Pseudomonas sp. 10C3 TaxID=3118753 RepID=UPI002E80969B|nr:hypothetical protein [Pseudomonas sp. 10C3]MEE3504885.1 hypothetical protein [Pseudomonas sp. 10C3]